MEPFTSQALPQAQHYKTGMQQSAKASPGEGKGHLNPGSPQDSKICTNKSTPWYTTFEWQQEKNSLSCARWVRGDQ